MKFKAGDVLANKYSGVLVQLLACDHDKNWWHTANHPVGDNGTLLFFEDLEHWVLIGTNVTLPVNEAQQSKDGEKDEPAEPSEYERLRDFFFPRKPQPRSIQSEQWQKEGRCPVCGQLGYFHLSTMVCTEHGPY
jgi:hypothetical protein